MKKTKTKFYSCVWVSKEDLMNCQLLTNREIKEITDKDMKKIAQLLGEYLIGDDYWDGIDFAVKKLKKSN